MIKNTFFRAAPLYGVDNVRPATIGMLTADYEALKRDLVVRQPDNIACHGYKVYSQTDEDGIVAAIFDRIGEGGKAFMEIGVGNGHECNTHLLLLKDWRGCWVEGSAAMCGRIRRELGQTEVPGRFALIEALVSNANIETLYRRGCDLAGVEQLDLFSLDIDGNDLHVLQAMLDGGARPRVLCLEYNGKFPPPLALTVDYDEKRSWDHTDHYGASLQALVDMLGPRGYRLITCNLVGTNVFFVRDELAGDFPTIAPQQVWQPLRQHLAPLPQGHKPSLGFLREHLGRTGVA